jgi:hypothetical protein
MIVYSKLIAKPLEVSLYMDTPGSKIIPNIDIMQITSQFEPFDHAK